MDDNLKLSAVLFLVFMMVFMDSFGQSRLPSGPTYKNVVIATVDDMGENFQLRTNIYLPQEPSESPVTLLLYIHGTVSPQIEKAAQDWILGMLLDSVSEY